MHRKWGLDGGAKREKETVAIKEDNLQLDKSLAGRFLRLLCIWLFNALARPPVRPSVRQKRSYPSENGVGRPAGPGKERSADRSIVYHTFGAFLLPEKGRKEGS